VICERCEREMIVYSRFKFEHEPSDSPRMRRQLAAFKSIGIELGGRPKKKPAGA
jgi:hypothetical protein